MFCKKCGSQIDEDSAFCPKCGCSSSNNVMEEQSVDSDSSLSPITKKKNLKKFLIPAISILSVVILFITGYATSFFGLIPSLHAKAPVALALKSLYAMKDLSSVELDLSVNNGESTYAISGCVVLGKDLKNSSLELSSTVNGNSGRAVYHQGNVGSLENGRYEYGSDIEKIKWEYTTEYVFENGVLLPEEYENRIQELESEINDAEDVENKENHQHELDVLQSAISLNDLVKNEAINITLIQDIILKQLEHQINSDLIQQIVGNPLDYEYFRTSDTAAKEAEKLFNDFVFKECEKESVYNEFISGFYKSKNGNLNSYSFGLDVPNFIITFLEYFRSRLYDFPELKIALDDYIKSANSNDYFNAKGFIDYTIRELNEKSNDYISNINKINISMELDKKNLLHSFEMSMYDNYNTINSSIKLKIKNHNRVEPDLDSINSFLDEAKEAVEIRAVYDEYLESKVEKINAQPDQSGCKTTSKKLFDFDDDGVNDFYYKIEYKAETTGVSCTQEGLCTISDGKVVELFAEGEGGIVDYAQNAYITTAYSNDLSKHVICVVGFQYQGTRGLSHNYYSMENGKLTPLDRLLYFEDPQNQYIKLNGKEVDEKTFFQAADKYTAPTNLDYIFTEYSWKPLRTLMEENEVKLGSVATSDASNSNETSINIDDYVGGWNINGQDYNSEGDFYETDLDITKLNNSQFSFWLFAFSREGFMNCETKLNGNRADFKYDDGVNVVIGTLTFSQNSIIVKITSSDMVCMPVGTMIFDSRHSHEGNRGGED